MQSPAYNLARGPLLQLLLIQTQYMRRELIKQMSAMDTLLRSNYFTASMSALLPGVLALSLTCMGLLGVVRRCRSRNRSRWWLHKQVRAVLHDAERLLLRGLSDGRTSLLHTELGLLVIGLHRLRQGLRRYRSLLQRGEMERLLEDLADLETDAFTVEHKLRVIERMYRTQPALQILPTSRRSGLRMRP